MIKCAIYFATFFTLGLCTTLPIELPFPIPQILQWTEQPSCPDPHPDSCAGYLKNVGNFSCMLDSFKQSVSDPDSTRKTPELITSKNYPIEIFDTETADGYILTTHRIPYSPYNTTTQNDTKKPPVLIIHGILGASHDFLLNPRERSLQSILFSSVKFELALMLADAGYDVFLGNSRGTSYSKTHKTLNNTDSRYWKFSFHEMGLYDISALTDAIRNKTNQDKIFYIGFSQGTTEIMINLSEYPENNAKYRHIVMMGPVAYYSNTTNPVLQGLAAASPPANLLFNLANGEFGLPSQLNMSKYFLCNANQMSQLVCANVLFAVFGFNYCEMNCSRVPLYLSHDPESVSLKDFFHYLQLIKSGKFREYDDRLIGGDFDPIFDNLPYPFNFFGAPEEYNLNNVKTNISMFSGKYDELANTEDVESLRIALTKNGVLEFDKFNEGMAHLDYYWGVHVKEEVYDHILVQLRKH